jgi:hypothetical protein
MMDDLVGSILERTSGSPCPRAREGLAERGLGPAVDPVSEELLRAHLETCEGCAALSRILAGLQETLPLLAEIEPGEEFTAQVLARTPPRRSPLRAWAARLGRALEALLARPRLAWEGAYLGVALLAVVFGLPGSPLRSVPGQVLEQVRRDPTAGLRASIGELESRVAEEGGAVWQSAAGRASVLATGVARESEKALRSIREDLGTFWDGLSSEESEDRGTTPPDEDTPAKGDRT